MHRKVFLIFFLCGISYVILQSQTQLSDRITQSSKDESVVSQEIADTVPSLDQIFTNDHTWTATLSADRKRTILVTGDVIPARDVNVQATEFNNFLWPFEKTANVVKDADITFINL